MRGNLAISILGLFSLSFSLFGCNSISQERKIEFVYLALGASDTTGVGATPVTEGYVYLVNRDLQQRISGTFLINFGVPGARIDSLIEQVRLAKHIRSKAKLATVWTGANDLVHGDDPSRFQSDLRELLRTLQSQVSKTVVIANIPNLTQLPVFRATPNPAVTLERIKVFNQAIKVEAAYVNASIVDVFAQPVQDDLVFDGDGFHPNETGHRLVEDLFLKVILERLGLG